MKKTNMKIAIIGAGYGGELIAEYFNKSPEAFYDFFGNPEIKFYDEFKGQHPSEITDDEMIIISSSNMPFRRRIFSSFERSRFININRSLCDVNMGFGNVIFPGAIFDYFHKIGDNNIISLGCLINHHCEIGDGNLLGPGCMLSGHVKIGNNCLIGSGVIFEPHVNIGNDVVICSGSVVVGDIKNKTHIRGEKKLDSISVYQGGRIVSGKS